MRFKRLRNPLIALSAFFIVFTALGFSFQHPKDGLSNALGSAESSIVIVKKVDEVKAGDKIVAGAKVGESPVLGIVASVKDGSIELFLEKGIARSTPDEVSGKLLLVIPFVGYLFNAVGL